MFTQNNKQEERKKICLECENYRKELWGIAEICAECGCIIPLKIKLEKSKCPLFKW